MSSIFPLAFDIFSTNFHFTKYSCTIFSHLSTDDGDQMTPKHFDVFLISLKRFYYYFKYNINL